MVIYSAKEVARVGALGDMLQSAEAEKTGALQALENLESEVCKINKEAAARQAQLEAQAKEIAGLTEKLGELESLRAKQMACLEEQLTPGALKRAEARARVAELELQVSEMTSSDLQQVSDAGQHTKSWDRQQARLSGRLSLDEGLMHSSTLRVTALPRLLCGIEVCSCHAFSTDGPSK